MYICIYICIYVYIYVYMYIYIYIIHTGETIEKPVDLGVRYVQTNPYIIPSIYSSMSENGAGYVQLHPLASTSPVHSEAWRWRHWHLKKPKLKRQGHDVIEAPIVKLHKTRVFDTKGKASRAQFFVLKTTAGEGRSRKVLPWLPSKPWHTKWNGMARPCYHPQLPCTKLIMSDHGTCDDSSFGIFNWPSFNQIHIYIYRLVQASGTTYDGVGGWGGMLTFMWTCGSSWCYAHAGWGGVGGILTFMWTCGRILRSCELAAAVDATHTRGEGGWGGF